MDSAIETEFRTLIRTGYWAVVDRLLKEKVLLTNFVLRRKRDEKGEIEMHKERPVVYINEKEDNEKACFPPVTDFIVVKIILSVVLQNTWHKRCFEFQNAFCNENLERTVCIDPPRCESFPKSKNQN